LFFVGLLLLLRESFYFLFLFFFLGLQSGGSFYNDR